MVESNYIQHYGVLGMKWGVRRYQNKDGTLTAAGKQRLDKYKSAQETRLTKHYARLERAVDNGLKKNPDSITMKAEKAQIKAIVNIEKKEISNLTLKDMKKERLEAGGAAIAGTLATAGGIASAATMGATGPIGVLGFIGGVSLGGKLLDVSTSTALGTKLRSEYSKALKRGNEMIAGSTLRLGERSMSDIDKKLKKKLGDLSPDAVVSGEVAKNASKIASDELRAEATRLSQQQLQQQMNRKLVSQQQQMINQMTNQMQMDIMNQMALQNAMNMHRF